MTDGDDGNWVSLKQASAQAGVSISWLRKQYRHNGLPTRDTVGPRGLQKAVPLRDVITRAAVFTSGSSAASPPAEPQVPALPTTLPADLTGELLDRLFAAQERAARAEAEAAYLILKLDDAYAEIEQFRDQLGQ